MHRRPSRLFLIWLSLWVVLALTAAGARAASDKNLRTIRGFLELPDAQIDLAVVKLTIDKMIDPNIDIAATLAQLDAMAAEVRARIPVNAPSRAKLEALKAYLYKAGPWNGYEPFRYDLERPFNHNRTKLLPTYLATHKGNCVSMPFLFLILGQKLGIPLYAAKAPEHVFVKYRDGDNLYNMETTSGAGFTRDGWMQQQMPMSAKALATGIYMRPLGTKETVVVMASTLLEWYEEQQQEERRIALARLLLKYDPSDVVAMLNISSASYRLRQRHFVKKYPRPVDIPQELRPYYAHLENEIMTWQDKARALGWQPPDDENDKKYGETLARIRLSKGDQK